MDYRNLLNNKQYEAVSSNAQYLRIVAGAGSGKTRVLTYRLAYLIDVMKANPRHILAIAFTNKVAKEMKERALKLVPSAGSALSISTFHSFCAKFLRQECGCIGFPSNFTVYDDDDQDKLVKSIAEEFGYKKKDDIVKQAIGYICSKKCEGYYPEEIMLGTYSNPQEKELLKFFTVYEERKNAMYGFDFDDLMLRTIRILESMPDIRAKWQARIDHILVDEFQDVNDVQFHLIKLLSKPSTYIYVVGDPDQTIYTWRGANQKIILDFDKTFRPSETIILDQNYRSTKRILSTANTLIDHNKLRIKKDLFTDNTEGDSVVINQSATKDMEASWVCKQINNLKNKNSNFSYKDVAVLYRSAYLTLPFEKELARLQIPYRMFGGLRFYQRREIKDVLAYVRLLFNPLDDVSFERIYNTPKRGIGDSSFVTLKEEKLAKKVSFYNYILHYSQYEEESNLSPKCAKTLVSLVNLLERYKARFTENLELYSKTIEEMIAEIGYMDYLASLDDGDDRMENVKSLYDDIYHFIKNNPESNFEQYLQNVSLATSQDDINEGNYVSLMTIHTAKGLEFPNVFVVGMNEGVFPSARSINESGYKGEEEERRLCYVAFTRAMEKLFLSCNNDYSFTVGSKMIPSKFFKEAGLKFEFEDSYKNSQWSSHSIFNKPTQSFFSDEPQEKPVQKVAPRPSSNTNNIGEWEVGDQLEHRAFGIGTVTKLIDNGTVIEVEFIDHGKKMLLAKHPAILRKITIGGLA